SGSCLNIKLTSAAGLSVFGGESCGIASFLIEFGAVIVRFQARQQQSDGLVFFGLVSFGLVSFGLVSFGLVSFGLVSFGLVSFGLVSFGLVSFGLVSFGLVSFGLVSFGLVSFGLVSFVLMFTARDIPPHSPGSLEDGRVGLRRAKPPKGAKTGSSTF